MINLEGIYREAIQLAQEEMTSQGKGQSVTELALQSGTSSKRPCVMLDSIRFAGEFPDVLTL